MWERRWIKRFAPAVAAVGTVVALAATSLGAPDRPWAPPGCTGVPVRHAAAGAWFRLDPIIDGGARRGQRLVIGSPTTASRSLALASESFAAGPFGGLVLAGTDDGSRSTISLIDIDAACTWQVGSSDDVIRRATVAPDGTALYEARVGRTDRADLGIWRRPIGGDGPPVRVLDPMPIDARFGRTWSTELTWSSEEGDLAVQTCGEVACRTRVLDPADGRVRTVADPGLGELVGLTDDRLIAHGACRGLPCPLLSVALDDGAVTTLHPLAGQAVLAITPDGDPRVVLESRPDGSALLAVRPTGADPTAVPGPGAGLQLVPGPSRSGGAVEAVPGWLVFGPGGRLPLGDGGTPLFRHIDDDRLVPLSEAIR